MMNGQHCQTTCQPCPYRHHHKSNQTILSTNGSLTILILLQVILYQFLLLAQCDDGDPLIQKFDFIENASLYTEASPSFSDQTNDNSTDSNYAGLLNSLGALNGSICKPTENATNSGDATSLFDSFMEFDQEAVSTNITSLPYELRTAATIACVITFIIGVTGNILVPLVVCRTRELCTNSTNVFLINLSIADLLILIVCMPTVLIELHSKPEVWTLGEFMCKHFSLFKNFHPIIFFNLVLYFM